MSQPIRAAWIEIAPVNMHDMLYFLSQPIRAAWIEIAMFFIIASAIIQSQPIRAAWIEIKVYNIYINIGAKCRSPLGLRGLKF